MAKKKAMTDAETSASEKEARFRALVRSVTCNSRHIRDLTVHWSNGTQEKFERAYMSEDEGLLKINFLDKDDLFIIVPDHAFRCIYVKQRGIELNGKEFTSPEEFETYLKSRFDEGLDP